MTLCKEISFMSRENLSEDIIGSDRINFEGKISDPRFSWFFSTEI
jgi:hypothetical protein